MKTTSLVLTLTILLITSHSVRADEGRDILPPPGPYRPVGDVGQYNFDQNIQNETQVRKKQGSMPVQMVKPDEDVPEWVRQRQIQMEQWMKQSNMPQMQHWPQQPSYQNYNSGIPMSNAYYGRMPERMQQPYPYARGQAYAPAMPPAEYYYQPNYQVPRQ
ncbi:MAG: hypothetical protein OEZ15_01985 [Gammaproteobacteria bacterium]|nr:hypothetical protein [Gammaproteobacteria bacterium]